MADYSLLTNRENNVREIAAHAVAISVSFSGMLEAEKRMLQKLRKRGPQKAPKKVPISIRLSPDVAEGLRASGKGWQSRANEALRSWLLEIRKGYMSHPGQNHEALDSTARRG